MEELISLTEKLKISNDDEELFYIEQFSTLDIFIGEKSFINPYTIRKNSSCTKNILKIGRKLVDENIFEPYEKEKDEENNEEISFQNKRIKFNDIHSFLNNGQKRNNDKNNKIRELVIFAILSKKIPDKWLLNENWKNIHTQLLQKVDDLCDKPFDTFTVSYKAGRKNHYDFLITYFKDKEECFTAQIEFKYNSKKIEDLPQFLSVSGNHFTTKSYASYFFDNYINKICNVFNIESPTKDDYLKYVHSSNHNTLKFFKDLRENEEKHKQEKKTLVKDSIKTFLEQDIFNLEAFNEKLKTQQNKVFLLWKNKHFYTDKFNDKELVCKNIKRIKNNNSIVLQTNMATEIHLLLRWRNRIGILYPAWQISLKR